MTDAFIFPDIDTSYWKTDDPEWVSERKNEWAKVERMLKEGSQKSKKAITIIKRYFLQGEMPDFNQLKDWDIYERHLDLFCFIWLHPSWNEEVLIDLRNAYLNSPVIKEDDAKYGLGFFLGSGKFEASEEYSEDRIGDIIHTEGHNELIFRVLMGDISDPILGKFSDVHWTTEKPKECITRLHGMTRWLCNKSLNFLNEDCLYQYDQPLEWWYQCCPSNEDFFKKPKYRRFLPLMQEAMYRIYHFDIVKEGDTARTRFVTKIRKMLDERDFIPEFKQMWEDVKAGKIEIENPWER